MERISLPLTAGLLFLCAPVAAYDGDSFWCRSEAGDRIVILEMLDAGELPERYLRDGD